MINDWQTSAANICDSLIWSLWKCPIEIWFWLRFDMVRDLWFLDKSRPIARRLFSDVAAILNFQSLCVSRDCGNPKDSYRINKRPWLTHRYRNGKYKYQSPGGTLTRNSYFCVTQKNLAFHESAFLFLK